jgi:hypothetical protein
MRQQLQKEDDYSFRMYNKPEHFLNDLMFRIKDGLPERLNSYKVLKLRRVSAKNGYWIISVRQR